VLSSAERDWRVLAGANGDGAGLWQGERSWRNVISHGGMRVILAGFLRKKLFVRSLSGILAGRAALWQGRGLSCWRSIEVWRTKPEVQLLGWIGDLVGGPLGGCCGGRIEG
jgi:hypothetical protein